MTDLARSLTVDASPEEVRDKLSPESIIEYAGTYSVDSREEIDGVTVLTVSSEDVDMGLEFVETDLGYVYNQRKDNGPFEELVTQIVVEGGEKTRITVHSSYTFGGIASFVTDWLAADLRRSEIDRFLKNLAADVEDSDPE